MSERGTLEEKIRKTARPEGMSDADWEKYLDSLRRDWNIAKELGPDRKIPEGFDKSKFGPE